ncbi:MAG: glycosyltransferase family 2 protein [Acidimicrobiales bacterium]|nr:glycosyltransferase family 2 protein [Acidimicrobiales bacterium]
MTGSATDHSPFVPLTGRRGRKRRQDALRQLLSDLCRADFDRRHPDARFGPVVVLIASYLEADNIGAVLKAVPNEVDGLGVSTLVVVDGGDDGTEDIVAEHGAYCARFPVNMGHGVALQLGYRLAREHGARYVVTVDADGQNDPTEIPDLIAPVLAGTKDFVIGSRRLGRDDTTDRFRRAGVVLFAAVISALTRQHLTDTSSGFRALRVEVLEDVTLEQEQYQSAELVISAAMRHWRLGERPTVWHPRASGQSKKGHNVFFGVHYARVIVQTWLRDRRPFPSS